MAVVVPALAIFVGLVLAALGVLAYASCNGLQAIWIGIGIGIIALGASLIGGRAVFYGLGPPCVGLILYGLVLGSSAHCL